MQYLCGTCGKKVDGDLRVFVDHTEGHIIEVIKRKNPAWVEKDGICQKCYEYLKKEMKGQ